MGDSLGNPPESVSLPESSLAEAAQQPENAVVSIPGQRTDGPGPVDFLRSIVCIPSFLDLVASANSVLASVTESDCFFRIFRTSLLRRVCTAPEYFG